MNPSDSGLAKTKSPIVRFWNAHFAWLWLLGFLIWIGIAIHAYQLSVSQQRPKISWEIIATYLLLIALASSILSQPARIIELAPGGAVTFALHYLVGAVENTQILCPEALDAQLRINTVPDSDSLEDSYELVMRINGADYQFRSFSALDDAEALKADIRAAHMSMMNLTQAS